LYAFERNIPLASGLLDLPSSLGRKSQERPDCRPGPASRPEFEDLAKEDESRDDGSGLEVKADLPSVRAEGRRKKAGKEDRENAIRKSRKPRPRL